MIAEQLRSPRAKLIAAAVLLLGLGAVASARGLELATAARLVLGLVALTALVLWYLRRRGDPARVRAATRLEVIARAPLSGRSALALVEVDGRPYLVVHGDGCAAVHEASSAPPGIQGRRPPPRRRLQAPVAQKLALR